VDNTGNTNIEGIEVEPYLLDCVTIEPLMIQEEFVRVPRDLAYWNQRYSDAYERLLTAKHEWERTKATAELRIRAVNEDAMAVEAETTPDDAKPKPAKGRARGGGLTEAAVAARLLLDDAVYAARVAYIAAEAEKNHLAGVLDAVRSKRDAVVSIGAHIRAEMQGDPAIRAQHQGASYHKKA